MTTTARLDPAAARAAAEQLYEERMTAVDTLVTTTNTARDLADQLAAAQRTVARAYADAQRAGWTDDDLKRIGLDTPARRAPGRPAGTRNRPAARPTSDTAAPATPDTDTDTDITTGPVAVVA